MRVLTLDDKGADVALWQQFLASQNLTPGKIDGFFGGRTRRATMKFQAAHDLEADGLLGAGTRAAAELLGYEAQEDLACEGAMHGGDDVIDHIGGVPIFETRGGAAVYFQTGMTIDADGAYRAYKICNKGLDLDDNGREPCGETGRWVGALTRDCGEPIVQGKDDPCPGYLISTTSLQDRTRGKTDPLRYVDSEMVPFIVLPGGHLGCAVLGDYALVVNTSNGKFVHAIAADAGPKHHVGEASIAVARALLGPKKASPRSGGTEDKIIRYIVFPGSADRRFPATDPRDTALLDRTLMHLNTTAATLFASLPAGHQESMLA